MAALSLAPQAAAAAEGPASTEAAATGEGAGNADAPPTQPAPAPAPTAAPTVAGGNNAPAAAPAPRVDAQLSLRGTIVWDGLEDRRVILSLADGSNLSGTVVAQDPSSVALARTSDGMVVAVPKGEITAVNMKREVVAGGLSSSTPVGIRPLEGGRTGYVAGAVLVGFGSPVALSGLVMLGVCPGCLYINLPLLLPGLGMIIGGAVSLKRAKQKDLRFRKAWGIPMAARMRLTPGFALTRQGGEVGFTLRF